jgi:hypothetical protein
VTKTRAVRFVALFGAAICAVAYCAFVLAGLNGGGPDVQDLWEIAIFARAHVILAWAGFAACGACGFLLRDRIADRLIIVGLVLGGLPVCWAAGLRFLYYDQPRGIFPGFEDETWRWLVNHIYAEFSIGIMIGFLGLAAITLASKRRRKPDVG